MRPPPRIVISFLSVLIAVMGMTSCASFDKDSKVLITVFSQGSDMDSPKTIFRRNIEGKQVVLKIIPEFTHKSIVAFHSFPAEDGTYGVTLKLDFKGMNALEIVTRLQQGGMLVSMVNAAVVDYVIIDEVVADGLFTIWRGLPEELIAAMDKEYPRIQALKKADAESSSEMLDMVPSTGKEKKAARERVKDAEKADAAEAKRKARGEVDFTPELPAGAAVPLSEALKSER
ncbi:MAG: hypothetical protein V4662_12170 [Verrucomicrobiota bacterium]